MALSNLTLAGLRHCLLLVVMSACFTHCRTRIRLPNGDAGNAGLILPGGFEALAVTDSVGPARHMAVNDNGDVYVRLQFANGGTGTSVALRDTNNDGKADIVQFFGNENARDGYGTSMRIYNGYLYSSSMRTVYRNKLIPGKLLPDTSTEVILTDDYENGIFWHMVKPLAFDDKGHMFVPFGVVSNACEDSIQAGKTHVIGMNPCPELKDRGGIWKFDANKTGQTQKDGVRYATGVRSIVAIDWNPDDKNLYIAMHGRDFLSELFPNYYSTWQSTVLPAEEFLKVTEGSDAGWPYYYYDQIKGKKLLAPEYGGDGAKEGKGTELLQPIIGFPAHWAPNDLLFYTGDQFPEHYRHGAFIAFHGSAVRAPYPQAGFFVAFIPFKNGKPTGTWEVFADGFANVDTVVNVNDAVYRPMGLAEGPDGSLYVSDSKKGKIWRIMFKGDRHKFGSSQLAYMETRKNSQSYIKTPDEFLDNRDNSSSLNMGTKLYVRHCSSCHQRNGEGDASRFPPLNGSEWVKGDRQRLIDIVLKGLTGPIEVKGRSYNVSMERQNFLSDKEVAELLNYVRHNFGNLKDDFDSSEVRKARIRLEVAKN